MLLYNSKAIYMESIYQTKIEWVEELNKLCVKHSHKLSILFLYRMKVKETMKKKDIGVW